MITKSLINKIGKSIRNAEDNGTSIEEKDLLILQDYRISYKPDVAAVFNKLSSISKKIRSDRIVSFRIKRIESILSKIRREPTMALGNMGDIAGCRCILWDEGAVKKLVAVIRNNFVVLDEKDYLIQPKQDGYKGYHFYIQSPIDNQRKIEIQIRSRETHNWATLVEIIDILFDFKIKEGQIVSDLNRFLWLMSIKNKLSIDEMRELIMIDKERKIYSRLNKIFISNYIPIRRKWLDISTNQSNAYYLIEVDENKESNIESFENYILAEKAYYSKFTSASKSNFVLTHIAKADFKKVCIAYSNYILIKHEYLNDWNKIVKALIDHNFTEGNKRKFDYYFDYLERNLTDSESQFDREIEVVDTIIKSLDKDKTNELFPAHGINEWLEELHTMINKQRSFVESIEEKKASLPSGFWSIFRSRDKKG